ncbi:hypothetical protein RJ639_013960 [Escallonia herrerae]|uniref:SMP-LTD domain-containing protein n=1 Tax=Escallonia herrerae TaxID=1293975 RepID=A0AA89ANN9_9ASTE|nr:hypothetical protein RJ639_013960 [Escallonia herrerae]
MYLFVADTEWERWSRTATQRQETPQTTNYKTKIVMPPRRSSRNTNNPHESPMNDGVAEAITEASDPSSSLTSAKKFLIFWVSPKVCPCKGSSESAQISGFPKRETVKVVVIGKSPQRRCIIRGCMIPNGGGNRHLSIEFANSATRGAKNFAVKQFTNEPDEEEPSQEPIQLASSNFTNFREDPIVDKLRTQLGVIHPIPSPPINRNIFGLFVLFFFVGVVFDKFLTSRKKTNSGNDGLPGIWPQVPTSFSLFLEKDLQRKESVEWVNMVLGKLWKVYRAGLENWLIGLLQPVIDNLKKPDYVERVEIKHFSLGDEPLSVRNVERRTSRRVNDLQ